MKAHFRRKHLYKEEYVNIDNESLLTFKNSILDSMKQFSNLNSFSLKSSENSAFNKVINSSETEFPQYTVIFFLLKFFIKKLLNF